MVSDSSHCRSNCPINFVLEIFGDKWTLLVIRDLMFKGKRHYSEFLSSDEGISTNILADRLQRLEENGIVDKQRDPDNHARLIYRLTQKGKDLLPVMLEITTWSGKHDAMTNAPKALLRALGRDRAPLIAKILSDLE